MTNPFYKFFKSEICQYCPEMAKLSKTRFDHLCKCIFKIACGSAIKHNTYDGYYSFSCQAHTKQQWRSGEFMRFCRENNIFDIKNYLHDNYTYGYKLTDELETCCQKMADIFPSSMKNFMYKDGRAIYRKDKQNQYRAHLALNLSPLVTINREKLEQLKTNITQAMSREHPLYLKYGDKEQAYYDRIGLNASYLLQSLDSNNHLSCYYKASRSGRLYGDGINLQNINKIIKNEALHNHYEYDIRNCHSSILYGLIQRYQPSLQLSCLEAYIENKNGFLQDIQFSTGIEREKIKIAILSLVYGATLTPYAEATLYKDTLGHDVNKFVNNCEIKGLYKDLREARNIVLKHAPIQRGFVINAIGNVICQSEKDAKILSHILQGYETDALYMAIANYPQEIVLLQHDGFTCIKPIDTKIIEAQFFEKHHLQIDYTEERLGIDKNNDGIDKYSRIYINTISNTLISENRCTA